LSVRSSPLLSLIILTSFQILSRRFMFVMLICLNLLLLIWHNWGQAPCVLSKSQC
jgi:hypothetical protein